MQIEKCPYPVYADGSPDYKDFTFSVDIDMTASDDPLYFAVKGEFKILNIGIKKLVNFGTAGCGLMVECDSTDYRELRPCSETFLEKFPKASFTGIVRITPVVYAKKDVEHYQNDSLAEEINSLDITIPEGGIIAADRELELSFSRSLPQAVDSICKFMPGDTADADFESDSIIIYIPRDVYKRYIRMTKNQKTIVTSMYFPPVLVNIIIAFFANAEEGYSHCKWYQAIKESMDRNHVDLGSCSAYAAMMAILGDLYVESTNYIPIDGDDAI